MTEPFPISVEPVGNDELKISWHQVFEGQPVDVYVAEHPGVSTQDIQVASARQTPVTVQGLSPHVRHYFLLQAADGSTSMVAARRDVPLQEGTNFRDLGGYPAADGKRVRWGRLFRSGHSAHLTDQDQAMVISLNIGVCCDFRRLDEQASAISRLCPSTRIVPLPISPGSSNSFFEQLRRQGGQPEEMAAFMVDINREFVRVYDEPYRQMFHELIALDERAFMFNCAAGKDRTGFAAALILSALGVSEEVILEDYLLTSRYYPWEREMSRVIHNYNEEAGGNLNEALVMPMLEVRPEYLAGAFATIDEDYGSVERYLEEALGVGSAERAILRAKLTA